ncbi:response regulator transcription factor [Clostridium thermarum]|uniref:response regulator transcription factor n=1 Tax=Clostridium thermarum TaxID=1716543 RepID=UPI001123BE7A|nr:response regulator transcription factor [Clostridium thermarum]
MLNSVKKKILIIEDEEKITEVIQSYLEKEEFEVHICTDGSAAFELFEQINPTLVILDLMLPGVNGEEICMRLRSISRVPIIILTAKADEQSILHCFNIGADDYVTKPFSPRQLVARVMALLRRTEEDVRLLSNIYSFNDGDLIVDDLKHEVKKQGEVVSLTNSEYKILVSMIQYPKKAFSREELVCRALGYDYEGIDRVIDTHVKNLRQKIESNPKEPKYILTVHGVGYKFGGE